MTKMDICDVLNGVYKNLDEVALNLLESNPRSEEYMRVQIAKRGILAIQESIIKEEKEQLGN